MDKNSVVKQFVSRMIDAMNDDSEVFEIDGQDGDLVFYISSKEDIMEVNVTQLLRVDGEPEQPTIAKFKLVIIDYTEKGLSR